MATAAIATVEHESVTGWDLKAERVRRGLRAQDIAERMNVSRVRVTAIESLHRVRPELVARYFAALDIERANSGGPP